MSRLRKYENDHHIDCVSFVILCRVFTDNNDFSALHSCKLSLSSSSSLLRRKGPLEAAVNYSKGYVEKIHTGLWKHEDKLGLEFHRN